MRYKNTDAVAIKEEGATKMPNELKPEDVVRDFETAMRNGKYFKYIYPKVTYGQLEAAIALLREKDAEIKRLTKERDYARIDCAVAEQLHYECKKELEEMSDDILDSIRAERDRYKAESERYQSAFIKAHNDAEQERFTCKNICEPTYKNLLETAISEAITEFALRLKSCEFYEVADQYDGMQYVDFCDWVDQIAQELKGETDGKSDL